MFLVSILFGYTALNLKDSKNGYQLLTEEAVLHPLLFHFFYFPDAVMADVVHQLECIWKQQTYLWAFCEGISQKGQLRETALCRVGSTSDS